MSKYKNHNHKRHLFLYKRLVLMLAGSGIFIVPEVLYNICNMCGRDLPDMSAQACAYISGKSLLPMLHI